MSAQQAWDAAACGLLTLAPDGVVLEANATLLGWTGRGRGDVVGRLLPELLSVGGRIYWETHLAPLLRVEGRLEEVALELVGADGRIPVLLSATTVEAADVQVALFRAHERASYERELLQTRRAADRTAGQLRGLQHVTSALSRALGVDAVAAALLDTTVAELGASAAALELLDSGSRPVLVDVRGAVPQPVTTDATTAAGGVLVALPGTDHLHGVLHVLPRTDAGADPLDTEVLASAGQQAGLALDRARLHEHSATVARELQSSLLAVAVPQDARFDIATSYRPGVAALEVGGDWFDAFLVDPGVLGVVVGDVVGRGLPAASAMGQLRSAVRAVATPDVGPAGLLSRLDRFVDSVEAAALATVAYAEIDLSSGTVVYACAGHPPPVLLPARGTARLLWEGRSTPLGSFVTPLTRSHGSVQLAPGDRLLLYTDGLVERRDRGLDEGLDRLVATASSVADLTPAQAVEQLTERLLRDQEGSDDVCVLLLAWHGDAFRSYVRADLAELSAARAALGSWLDAVGASPALRDDVVLATSEAVANAAEHGLRSDPERSVRVRAEIVPSDGGEQVAVQVLDDGAWRPPAGSVERGRGLRIMRALVDDVRVLTGEGTSVELRVLLRPAS